jgi:putative N6-adenine-specific DNA methylase
VSARFEIFAVTAPGLERVTSAELQALGIDATAETGGLTWSGSMADVYRACLELRTATRVLVRVARFRARSFIELERHCRKVDWARHLARDTPVRVRASSRKSKLYHERAVQERLERWISEATGGPTAPTQGEAEVEGGEEDAGADAQLIVVRLLRDDCLISVDATGTLLHRRGYRQALAGAPLRETLAAGMLLGIGWDGTVPLIDPMCGSGTIPIEAALIARRIPPALASASRVPRPFAFERWADHDPELWGGIVSEARGRILERATTTISASDRDVGAIESARANADRAGVGADIDFRVAALSVTDVRGPAGVLVTNPPYGVRLGEAGALKDLYAALGNLVRARMPGWQVAFLAAEEALARQTRLELIPVLATRNGGIDVRLMVAGAPSTPFAPQGAKIAASEA